MYDATLNEDGEMKSLQAFCYWGVPHQIILTTVATTYYTKGLPVLPERDAFIWNEFEDPSSDVHGQCRVYCIL